MTALEELIEHFKKFPGIGPRQARRFAYHLLRVEPSDVAMLSKLIASIQEKVTECSQCFCYYAHNGQSDACNICADTARNPKLLTIVEHDSDIVSIEKSGMYDGYYFVLGGTVPLFDSKDATKLRSGALKSIVDKRAKKGLKEIILAFSVNPDGENTRRYVEKILNDLTEKHDLKITVLGRGLSTGSELEYADPETIKNALRNRQ